jgi:hypothetical protein
MRFKTYIESDGDMGEEKNDILKTLGKLPTSHRNNIKGYSWKFQGGNTLNGDDKHVGYMDDHEKEIAVAAPWNFPREWCALHEIAHVILERLPSQIKQQWVQLVKRTIQKQIKDNPNAADSLDQNPEEIFCHSYACFYSKHKLATYNNPEWMNFIKNLPQ